MLPVQYNYVRDKRLEFKIRKEIQFQDELLQEHIRRAEESRTKLEEQIQKRLATE